ncbi:hypothetical protein MJD09_06655 [bacterium]|nr:hypothetical protein [bacterium]
MKARLNRQLFMQSVFDSGALGGTTSVVHQFCEDGEYKGVVRQRGQVVGQFAFHVDDQSSVGQADFDLAVIASDQQNSEEYQCCCKDREGKGVVISPKGYALFYASRGTGFSVRVGKLESRKPDFNSERLTSGDLFALSLLEPTKYSLRDTQSNAEGEIEVVFTARHAKRLPSLQPIRVEVTDSGFTPSNLKLVSTQGLVFQIQDKSRVLIEKLAEG